MIPEMTPSDRAAWMRKVAMRCFVVMWIPFAGIFIGMWGMPSGSYAWFEVPQIARVSMVATSVFFFLTFALFLGSFAVKARARRFVLRNGRLAEAEILDAATTGVTVNEQPMYRLTLRVTPPGAPEFEATTERVINHLEAALYQIGTKLTVKYLPGSQEIAIADGDQRS